jgi:hypothetical protein
MDEPEDGGMKQDAWENHRVSNPGAEAIDSITKNWIHNRTEMNTNLVGSTRVNPASQEAVSASEGTFQMPFGQGRTSPAAATNRHSMPLPRVTNDRAVDPALGFWWHPPDQGQVFLAQASLRKLLGQASMSEV